MADLHMSSWYDRRFHGVIASWYAVHLKNAVRPRVNKGIHPRWSRLVEGSCFAGCSVPSSLQWRDWVESSRSDHPLISEESYWPMEKINYVMIWSSKVSEPSAMTWSGVSPQNLPESIKTCLQCDVCHHVPKWAAYQKKLYQMFATYQCIDAELPLITSYFLEWIEYSWMAESQHFRFISWCSFWTEFVSGSNH